MAVVDDDQPTTVDGQPVHAGADFVDSLHAKGSFDWRDVDDVDDADAEADRGLGEGDYYLVVHVPADSSADLVSGQGDDPERARITLRRDATTPTASSSAAW